MAESDQEMGCPPLTSLRAVLAGGFLSRVQRTAGIIQDVAIRRNTSMLSPHSRTPEIRLAGRACHVAFRPTYLFLIRSRTHRFVRERADHELVGMFGYTDDNSRKKSAQCRCTQPGCSPCMLAICATRHRQLSQHGSRDHCCTTAVVIR